ncbi:nuclear receptor coactivator 5-like [Uloborus diversus]|uniref:nuclear receptor coactivator 5-like n=1 Tax=Uloborus diversus TaxID=327109 RepID=UPI00240971E3|nr:nuclear receptor coactivator 5-like [Uloborus diversus]
MSFRGELGKMEDSRKFDQDKGDADDRASRFDPSRGRRPPFVGGRGRRPSPPGRDGKPFGDRQREFGGYGRNENDFPPPAGMRDRSPLQGAPDDRYFKKNDRREEAGRKFYEDPPRDRYQSMEGGRGRHEGGYGGSRFDTPVDFKHRPSGGYSAPPPGKDYGDGFPKPNECEIIAMNRQQRLYAESVESRVKGLGILVDVLFLKDEALLTQTIDDIARKGSLYAMVISPQNETHGSVTVNILHGTPQEHRNMPLEDALKLLSRNFHEWVRAQREQVERERSERGPYTGAVAADREMQLLLRMLADGRWVSLAEINSVVLYLTERRDKMRGDERVRPEPPLYKPPPPAPLKDDVDVAQKEQDLQNRIMNIMNQGAPVGGDVPPARAAALEPPVVPPPKPDPEAFGGPASKSESATTPTYINFDNPSVQKALDNLMQSGPNLLKSISLTTPAAPSKQPPFAGGRGMPEATPAREGPPWAWTRCRRAPAWACLRPATERLPGWGGWMRCLLAPAWAPCRPETTFPAWGAWTTCRLVPAWAACRPVRQAGTVAAWEPSEGATEGPLPTAWDSSGAATPRRDRTRA